MMYQGRIKVGVPPEHTRDTIESIANLRRSIQSTILRQCLNRAMLPVVKAIKAVVPEGKQPAVWADGTVRPRLKDTVTRRVTQFRDGTGYNGITGFRGRSDGKRGSLAPHAHLVNNGTTQRFRTIINGRYASVMFNMDRWMQLSLRSQQRATVSGLYQRFVAARWEAISPGARQQKLRTGFVEGRNFIALAWSASQSQFKTVFYTTFAEKVTSRAARQSSYASATNMAD